MGTASPNRCPDSFQADNCQYSWGKMQLLHHWHISKRLAGDETLVQCLSHSAPLITNSGSKVHLGQQLGDLREPTKFVYISYNSCSVDVRIQTVNCYRDITLEQCIKTSLNNLLKPETSDWCRRHLLLHDCALPHKNQSCQRILNEKKKKKVWRPYRPFPLI